MTQHPPYIFKGLLAVLKKQNKQINNTFQSNISRKLATALLLDSYDLCESFHVLLETILDIHVDKTNF